MEQAECTGQNNITLPEDERKCSFTLCSKCINGSCTLSPEWECDFETQNRLLSDLLPAIVKAHIEQDSNVVRIRAEGAAFDLRHSGNEAAAEKLTQLAQKINPNAKRAAVSTTPPASETQAKPSATATGSRRFYATGSDTVYGMNFEQEFSEALDRSEPDEVIRYAIAFWNIIHGQGISVTATLKGKNDNEVAARLRELETGKLRSVCYKLFSKTVQMWLAGASGVNGAKSVITATLRPVYHADD